MLYLDEIVEACKDTTLVIYPLQTATAAYLDKKLVQAHADFQLVISINPGYQIQP